MANSSSSGLFGLSWITIAIIVVVLYFVMKGRKNRQNSMFGTGSSGTTWVIIAAVAFFLFFTPLGTGGPGLGNSNDDANLNSCGCGPDQLVEVGRKRWLTGKIDSVGAVSCTEALKRTNRWGGDRWSILGCYNA